jgi:hypothetical protein
MLHQADRMPGRLTIAHEIAAALFLGSDLEMRGDPVVALFLQISRVGVELAGRFQLLDDIARVEVVEDTHELAEVNVADALALHAAEPMCAGC